MEVNQLVKWCRKCEENTERVGKAKRCKVCRDRLNVESRAKAKAAGEADSAVLKEQREAAAERSRRYRERQREEKRITAGMTTLERLLYRWERDAAQRTEREAQR